MSKYTKDLVLGLMMAIAIVIGASIEAKSDDSLNYKISDKGQRVIWDFYIQSIEGMKYDQLSYLGVAAVMEPGNGLPEKTCKSIEDELYITQDDSIAVNKNSFLVFHSLKTVLLMNECKDYTDPNSGAGKRIYNLNKNVIPKESQSNYDAQCRVLNIRLSSWIERFSRLSFRAGILQAAGPDYEVDKNIELLKMGKYLEKLESSTQNFIDAGCLKQAADDDKKSIVEAPSRLRDTLFGFLNNDAI